MILLELGKSIKNVAFGAGATTAAAVVGANVSATLYPDNSIATIVGIVAAVAAAMAWVDQRIERKLADRDVIANARADTRDANLLRKVEEMMDR